MKKILAFLLAAMLLLSIVGCAAQTQSDAQPAAARLPESLRRSRRIHPG